MCVSHLISRGDFEGLKGLLSPECISEVSKNLSNYSLQDRHMLAVEEDDIYFAFPYQIGMIIEDDPPPSKSWCELICFRLGRYSWWLREIEIELKQPCKTILKA